MSASSTSSRDLVSPECGQGPARAERAAQGAACHGAESSVSANRSKRDFIGVVRGLSIIGRAVVPGTFADHLDGVGQRRSGCCVRYVQYRCLEIRIDSAMLAKDEPIFVSNDNDDG